MSNPKRYETNVLGGSPENPIFVSGNFQSNFSGNINVPGTITIGNSASLYVTVLNSSSFSTPTLETTEQPYLMQMSSSFRLSGSSLLSLYGYHTISGTRYIQLFISSGTPTNGTPPNITIPLDGPLSTFSLDYSDVGGIKTPNDLWVILSNNSSSLNLDNSNALTIKGIMKT